jgi:hypothetical protein
VPFHSYNGVDSLLASPTVLPFVLLPAYGRIVNPGKQTASLASDPHLHDATTLTTLRLCAIESNAYTARMHEGVKIAVYHTRRLARTLEETIPRFSGPLRSYFHSTLIASIKTGSIALFSVLWSTYTTS